jgi:hypothetical protein
VIETTQQSGGYVVGICNLVFFDEFLFPRFVSKGGESKIIFAFDTLQRMKWVSTEFIFKTQENIMCCCQTNVITVQVAKLLAWKIDR